MTSSEIFENLMEPIHRKLTEEEWLFLLSRGEIFMRQISTEIKDTVRQLHYKLSCEIYSIMEANLNLTGDEFRNLPEVKKVWSAMDVIKPYIEKD